MIQTIIRPRRLRSLLAGGIAIAAAMSSVQASAASGPTSDDPYARALAAADERAAAGDDAGALAAWRSAYAELPPDDPVARRDLLRRIGQAEVRQFDATNDASHLRRAAATLGDAVATCPTPDDAECASARADLQDVQRRLEWEPEPSSVAIADAPPPAAPPKAEPSLDELERRRKLKSANAVAITGGAIAGTGVVALVLLSLPALIAAEVAEDRAADDPFLVSEEELHRRAANRRRFARITAIAAGGAIVVGGIVMGAGLGARHRIKHPKASALLLPGGGGVALSAHF